MRVERFFKQALETLKNNNCKPGDTINAFNQRVDKSGLSPTLTTRPEGFKTAILPVVENKNMEKETEEKEEYGIRKITPRECWRLMGFDEEAFEKAQKVNSNSQLYKQAGNSIVVACLIAIFCQLGISGIKKWNDMTDQERNFLINKGCFSDGK